MDSTDIDFMNELEAAARLRPTRASTILLAAIGGFVLLFILWASFSPVEEITHGSGQVVPSQEIQVVQSLEGGVLSELLVNEGDRVEKGQVLMRISAVQFASEERGVEAKAAALMIKKARLTAEANAQPFNMPADLSKKSPTIAANEMSLYGSRQKELENALSILRDKIASAKSDLAETNAEVQRLKDSRNMLSQELALTQKMVEQKAVPKLDAMRLQRELSDISGQLSSNSEKLSGLRADISGSERQLQDQRDKFRSQALGELNDVETELAQLQQNLTSIGDRVDRAELRAPVAGIINKVNLKTVGGVVEPAHKLIEIVPLDADLKIIARVLPNDIAFLKTGQPVKVRISAYDSQRYGSLEGKLTRIGANSVNDAKGDVFFEVEVHTDKNYLGSESHPLPITPGMVAETEVITGRKTIMEYLMKPVLRLKDRALTER